MVALVLQTETENITERWRTGPLPLVISDFRLRSICELSVLGEGREGIVGVALSEKD